MLEISDDRQAHYFSRDAALAESAVTKLEARQGAGAKGAPEEK
jgi:hypothetical protein